MKVYINRQMQNESYKTMNPFILLRSSILLLLLGSAYISKGQPAHPFVKQPPLAIATDSNMFTENAPVWVVSNRPVDIQSNEVIAGRGLTDRKQPAMTFFTATYAADTFRLAQTHSYASLIDAIPLEQAVLLYVNGNGKSLQQNIDRGIALSKRFGVSVIVFDWPTNNLSLRKSRWYAGKVSGNLATIIQLTAGYFEQTPNGGPTISILFHSLANQALKKMVINGQSNSLAHDIVDNMVLNAAAVNKRNHAEWLDSIHFARNILITINSEDRPLKGASFFLGAQQLGALDEGPLSTEARYINFTPIAGEAHSYFMGKNAFEAQHKNVYLFYKSAFRGDEINLNDTNMFKKRDDGLGFNIY